MGARRRGVLGDTLESSGFCGETRCEFALVNSSSIPTAASCDKARRSDTCHPRPSSSCACYSRIVRGRFRRPSYTSGCGRPRSSPTRRSRAWSPRFVRRSGRQRGTQASCEPCIALATRSRESQRRCRRTDQLAAERARCWIIWEWGQVPLTDGEHLLGRDGDVAVWLESPSVSRHHARVRVSGTEVTIEDLASKNGTYLRDERLIAPSPLTDGDDIRLGSVVVKFRVAGSGGVTETQHFQ